MEKTHVFEAAGLGKAPFVFVGYYEDRGPKQIDSTNGLTLTVGTPGQPMGTCEYCGTGIAICCQIQSADGKTFVVGSDCVAKTGDAGLKANVDEMKAKLQREKQDATIASNWQWVEENREKLALLPYGKYTMLESIEWFYKNAGRSGKIRIVRVAKKAL
jgi:hypothetical protein